MYFCASSVIALTVLFVITELCHWNYLDSERGYVENWAFYINDRQMTREEALDFLRSINTNPGRYVHIVDMENFDAWSASYPAGHDEIDTYHRF